MASTEFSLLTFGFKLPTEGDFGKLAHAILTRADENLRRSRARALLYLFPSLLFYLVYAAGVSLVLLSLDLKLSNTVFQLTVALSFLFMSGLGKYYQTEETANIFEARLRLQRIMMLQALFVKAITSIFFIIPYRVVSNLSRIFPKTARVNPQVVNLAVNLAASLDVPIRSKEVLSILPRDVPPVALSEALLLLKWSGHINTVPRGGDIFIYPSVLLDGEMSNLNLDIETYQPFSSLLAEEGEAREVVDLQEGDVSPTAPAREPPALLKPFHDSPAKSWSILIGTLMVIFISYKLFFAWYSKLPVSIKPAALPVSSDVESVTYGSGNFYLGRGTSVERTTRLDSLSEETIQLTHLRRLWGKPGMASAKGESRLSFKKVEWAEKDPGGRYLLVAGRWKFDPGKVSGSGRGLAVIDLQRKTFYACSQFDLIPVKGWWDEGRLLVTRASLSWEQGGGRRASSDNLSGTVMALDVESGKKTTVLTPSEAYYAYAGREGGNRIFLAADIERDKSTGENFFTFSEYRDASKVNSFTWTVKGFEPLIRQAELDVTGAYWIIVIEWPPTLAAIYGGTHYSIWIFSRNGSRWREVTERGGEDLFYLTAFPYGGRSCFSCLEDMQKPLLKAFEITN